MEPDMSTQQEDKAVLNYLPVDLIPAAAAIIIGSLAVIVDSASQNPARIPFTLPLVLFLPGYSLLAALYPRPSVLSPEARVALSVAFSVAIVPMMSLLLASSPLGFTRESLLAAVAIASIALLVMATVRRLVDRPDPDATGAPVEADTDIAPEKVGLSVNIALLLFALVIMVPVVGSAFTEKTELYTEFYMLEPNETSIASASSPSSAAVAPVTLGIVNHEGRAVDYTVVIQVHGLANSTARTRGYSTIAEVQRVTVQDRTQYQLLYTPAARFNRAERIDFLLFRDVDLATAHIDSVPVDPGTAYRSLLLWLRPD